MNSKIHRSQILNNLEMSMSQSRAEYFTNVYTQNLWGDAQSRSGCGSTTSMAKELAESLPPLLAKLGVKSILDLPCGDFTWMQHVDLRAVAYIGGDIVQDLVDRNNELFGSALRRFELLDLVKDDLPCVDMVFVRDCFIHFTNELVLTSLANIARSGAKYLCMTHDLNPLRYPDGRNIELDRAENGVNFEYRPIHFELPPFSLPPPVDFLLDSRAWDDWNGKKAMGVWEVATIKEVLAASLRL